MFPKSLVIAVLSGIVASASLGTFFITLNMQQQELEFVDGPSVSILADKIDYKLGEKVVITVVNTGTSKISFQAEMPSLRIRALDGTVFFSTSFGGLALEPGQQHVFEWNQLKNDNSQILEGRYVIDSFAYGDGEQLGDSATVNVHK
ncbi:hypothetical protein [Candidatus Nitrosotenuis cloacae]|jgi:hypothetical protein|uniref:hypothetical protein n=1 Tax=Candidatus Nitrosotenuis cloacae TaxID=1603555 RepID=UPI00227E3424|nr:hypothetical protein [Candidatus Nitrosotenuis cloacae]